MLIAKVIGEAHRMLQETRVLWLYEQGLSNRGYYTRVPASACKALPCIFPRLCRAAWAMVVVG